MKKSLIAQIFVFTFVFFLIKTEHPSADGTKNLYYTGIPSSITTTDVNQTYKFDTIKDAYTKQLELGEGWDIVKE